MKSGDYVEADIGMGLCSYGIITNVYPYELNSNNGFIWVHFIDEKRPALLFASNLRVLSDVEIFKSKLTGSSIREQKHNPSRS